ncbi:MAG: SpoIIE family protein phosphatase [Flavobacteriales bacterium]|jgi:serine phosphatase RsbU (regulator of sigma subunit)/HAMP domain-containing protein|nr:SpoIIE family protein phosphatase [Flavobacteriales bacterium]
MRFTVGKKIGLGFGIVLVLLLTVFVITLYVLKNAESTLKKSIDTNDQFLKVGQPSVFQLNNLKKDLTNTHMFIQQWLEVEATNDASQKQKANELMDSIVPADTIKINELSIRWSELNNNLILYSEIKNDISKLFGDYNDNVRTQLNDGFKSYKNWDYFMLKTLFEMETEPKYNSLMVKMDTLISNKNLEANQQQLQSNTAFKGTNTNFKRLSVGVLIAGIALVLGTIIIALFTTLSITRPVQQLKKILVDLGRGVFPKKQINPSNDEIGEMSVAMNSLVEGLQKTTSFAHEVGQSNFNFPYKPLSDDDDLGHALLKMKDELAETERILEQKVKERTQEVVKQKDEIDNQKSKLEELYKDVTDSIRYAKRLQDSILPPKRYIQNLFPSSFVLFKPKDIVSGDFYWMNKIGSKHIFAAVDCTGHGVPGAFMSLVGANGLNAAVKEHRLQSPGKILDDLNNYASESLYKQGDENAIRDGMDIAICSIDYKKMLLEYAGAYNPLYIVRDNEIVITKGDKFAIGSFNPYTKSFATHKIPLLAGDIVYVFSDGYADQFGGLKGKKYMYKQFRETLLSIKDLPMEEQRLALDNKIETWKGSYEQVDDILIIGVQIN